MTTMATATLVRALQLAAASLCLTACAGGGPLGEPAHGLQGLKNAAADAEAQKVNGRTPPRGGGSAIAPTGPDGAPTAGPTDAIGPH